MLKWTSLVENALTRRGQRLLNDRIHDRRSVICIE
jgi:hypothetical protein